MPTKPNIVVLLSLLWPFFAGNESSAGTVEGTATIKVVEKPQRPPRYYLGLRRSARQTTGQEHAASKDLVVFLDGVPQQEGSSLPRQNPRMLQQHGRFIPHVLPILAGATVEFPNQDDFYHNVFSVVAGDRFDLGRFAAGKSEQQPFTKPGVVVVRCEIHSGMKAFIVVLENPYFAVPDTTGRFEIPAVPTGTYTIKAWHPTQGEQSRSITVPDAAAVEVNFAF